MEQPRPLTRREAVRFRRRRPSTVTIPERAGPHVRLVFAEMQRQNVKYDDLAEKSGVRRAGIKAWRFRNYPGLASMEAVLGALGFDFVPIPRERVLPAALVADLAPIAERHSMTMAGTIEAMIAIVAGVHERFEAPSLAPSLDDIAEAPARGVGGTDIPTSA